MLLSIQDLKVSFRMGEGRRAQYAREMVFETTRYPEVRLRIDSLVHVTRQADTLHGTAAIAAFALQPDDTRAVARGQDADQQQQAELPAPRAHGFSPASSCSSRGRSGLRG